MEFLQTINLEQLGTAGLFIAYLIYSNWELKKDVRSKDCYIQELSKLTQESQLESLETLTKLEQAFMLLREKLS